MEAFDPNMPPPTLEPSDEPRQEVPAFDPDMPPPNVTEQKLDQAHKYYTENADKLWGRTSGSYLTERLPGVNLASGIEGYFRLSGAIKGLKSGNPSDEDISTMAQFKAKRDYEASKSFGGSAVDMVTKVPALVTEFAVGGGAGVAAGKAATAAAAKAAGVGLTAKAAGYAARIATQTALTPSMYLDHAVTNNIEKDRDPLDPRGLPGAYGLALAQNMVLGEVGRQTGKVFTGSGLGQAAGRVGVQAASGPFAQAATDLVTGVMGLSTGYGSGKDLLDGKYGEAAQHAVMDALTFGSFGLAHEIVGGKGHEKTSEAILEKIKTTLDEQAKKGATPDQAAAVMSQEVEALKKEVSQAPVLKNAKGDVLETPKAILDAIKEVNPNPDSKTVEAAMKTLPEGPLRDEGLKIAAGIAEQAKAPVDPAAPPPVVEPTDTPPSVTPEVKPVEPSGVTGVTPEPPVEVPSPVVDTPVVEPVTPPVVEAKDHLTAEQRMAVKNWMLNNDWTENDINKMSPAQQDEIIARRYTGGMEGFKANNPPEVEAPVAPKPQDPARVQWEKELKNRIGLIEDRLAQAKARAKKGYPNGNEVRSLTANLADAKAALAKGPEVKQTKVSVPVAEAIPTDPVEIGKKMTGVFDQLEAARAEQRKGGDRQATERRIQELENQFHDLHQAAGAADLRQMIDEVGSLTAREKHVINQRILRRGQDSIGSDPEMMTKGRKKPLTRARVQQIEKDALKKIGVENKSIDTIIKQQDKAAAEEVARDAAGRVTRGELSQDPTEVKAQNPQGLTPDELLSNKWHDYLTKLRDSNELATLPPADVKRFREILAKLATTGPPEGSVREILDAQRKTGKQAPVQSEGVSGVQQDPAQRSTVAPEENGQGNRPGAGAESGQATGDQLISKFIAPKEHADAVADAKKAGYSQSEIAEIIGEIEREVAGLIQAEARAAESKRTGSGEEPRPAATDQSGSAPVDQPAGDAVEIAPNVFLHRGSGGTYSHKGPRPKPAAGGIPESGYVDDIKKALAPATRGTHAQAAGQVFKHNLAIMAREKAIAQERLKEAEKYFDTHIVAAPGPAREQRFSDFFDPIEKGKIANLPPEQQAFAQALRDLFDQRTDELVKRGLVQSTIDNYITHLWEKPGTKPKGILGFLGGRKPLAGREGFRKKRVIDTFREGIDMGLTPVDWNPARLAVKALEQMDKSIMAHDSVEELKAKGLWHFVGIGKKAPESWEQISDKMAKVFAPGQAEVKEYFDKQQMEGLEKFATKLGINLERVMKGLGNAVGMAQTGGGQPDVVTTKFGSPEEILAHEIGHVLDSRYGMAQWLNDPVVSKELIDLADLRASGRVDPNYKAYLRSDPERMANLVAAYLHAPELLNQVAPNAMAHLESLLSSKPELRAMRDIKPSLELDSRQQTMRLAGPILTGGYYTPEPVARIMENYLQPGLRGNKIFDAVREFGNIQNLFQLGFGAFHGGFVTMDTQISAVALGLQQISRGDFMKGLKNIATAPAAPVRAWTQGSKMLSEYFGPGSQGAEIAALVDHLEQGGGRAAMEEFYGGTHLAKLRASLAEVKRGDKSAYAGTLYHALPALAEAVSKPVMEALVPRMKMGVFADMARYEMEKLGPNASLDAKRQAMGKAWESVENRLGQMTYDNVFWNRTLKDLMMVSIRSVGWNVGTIREVAGGLKDVPKSLVGLKSGKGVSSRTAYVAGLAMVTGFYGSIYQYLATGKGPDELKDMYFPKTGKTRPDGSPDRVSLPAYTRDVAHVANRADEGPLRVTQNLAEMAKGKMNPGLTTAYDMLMNEDFFGTAIRNPNDSAVRQAMDTAKFLLGSFEPFTSRSYRAGTDKGLAPGQMLQGAVGITPAPAYITRTAAQQRAMETERKSVMTPLARKIKKDQSK